MSIAFQQTSSFSAASPATSGSFTPAVPGSLLMVFAQDGAGGNTPSYAGTGTWSPVGVSVALPAANESSGANVSSTAGAQTVTVTASGGAFRCWFAEYSGALLMSSFTAVQRITPGTGSGSILGSSVSVPSGSVLVAICIDVSAVTAITTTNGTSRQSTSIGGQGYNFVDFAGAGSAIQPAFTSTGGATDTFNVVQAILTPGIANSATIAWVS